MNGKCDVVGCRNEVDVLYRTATIRGDFCTKHHADLQNDKPVDIIRNGHRKTVKIPHVRFESPVMEKKTGLERWMG